MDVRSYESGFQDIDTCREQVAIGLVNSLYRC